MMNLMCACVCVRASGVTVREEVVDVLAEELSYLVSDLSPFTEYTFRVSASTTVGEGPATDIIEKTSEQGGWSYYNFTNFSNKNTYFFFFQSL